MAMEPDAPLPRLAVDISPRVRAEVLAILKETLDVDPLLLPSSSMVEFCANVIDGAVSATAPAVRKRIDPPLPVPLSLL